MSRVKYLPFLNRETKSKYQALLKASAGGIRLRLDGESFRPRVTQSVLKPNQLQAGNTIPEDKQSIHYALGPTARMLSGHYTIIHYLCGAVNTHATLLWMGCVRYPDVD